MEADARRGLRLSYGREHGVHVTSIITWKLEVAQKVSEAHQFQQPENVAAFLVMLAMAVRKGAGLPPNGMLGAASIMLDAEREKAMGVAP
jgi:hypothetical protein